MSVDFIPQEPKFELRMLNQWLEKHFLPDGLRRPQQSNCEPADRKFSQGMSLEIGLAMKQGSPLEVWP